MVDDGPEHTTSLPDSGRARREPPTIDLEATEIPNEAAGVTENAGDAPVEPPPPAPAAPVSPWVAAFVSGLVAASLVIGVGWILGWPAVPPTPPAAPQVSTAAVDGLAARIASIEAKTAKPPAASPDPATTGRIAALEKSVAALSGDLANVRTQSDKLVADQKDAKPAPGEAAASPDISAINDRIAQLEHAITADSAAIAQQGAKAASAKPADDLSLRRVVTATLLDISARQGDPYVTTLAAAKSLAANPDALKPLDGFAAKGVPSANAMSRELLTLIPKLSPPTQDKAAADSSILERLKAGAAKLVPIERTDATGTDRGAVVARATAAALHNDAVEARRELKTLPPADRAAAQEWLDKSDARDAALAAARRFADDAIADLARPGQ
jgi:hypothetical protein